MILLIDGNNLAYRALYTMNLSTNDGEDVSVLYGVIKMLCGLIKKYHPTSVVVCWDGGTPYYRRALWPAYKAHRKRDDSIDWDGVFAQFDELRDYILPRMGILVLCGDGIEADDLMAQMALLAMDHAYIITTDSDLLQMVSPTVSVVNPIKDVMYTQANFYSLLEMFPHEYLLYKVLVGDSSDNVPGVRHIGPKTAIRLLAEMRKSGSDNPYDRAWLGCLNIRQVEALRSHEQAFWEWYALMELHVDRVGARRVIVRQYPTWRLADLAFIKRYFLRREFVSLLGADTVKPFAGLDIPEIPAEIRCPVYTPLRASLV